MYVTRVSADEYRLETEAGRGAWARWTIGTIATPPGGKTPPTHQFRSITIEYPQLSLDDNDASFTYTGSGWSVFSGSHRTSTTGDYMEWTTPDGVTNVSLLPARASNCGYALVSVDGSTDAANLLPTAQDEIDAGRLSSAALVASGGTLNPTDRLLNCHTGASSYNRTVVADGLPPGVHVVRMTCTGYKQGTSSDVRITITSARYGGATLTNPSTGSILWATGKLVMTQSSAFEFAYRMRAGTTDEWIGNVHGYEAESAFQVSVDSSPVSMSDGQVLSGMAVTLDSAREFYHPAVGSGATVVGECDVNYSLTQAGLTVSHLTDWIETLTPVTAYPAMLPAHDLDFDIRYETFRRGSGSDIAADVILDAHDNSRLPLDESDTAWMWSPGGDVVVAARVADVQAALQGFAYAGTDKVFIEDRSGATNARLNKAYWTLKSDGTSLGSMPDVGSSDTWECSATYRVGIVSDADALCSRA